MARLSVEVREEAQGQARVTVSGDLTRDNAYMLHRAVDAATSMYPRVTVDLSGSPRVDPGELAGLRTLADGLRDHGSDLRVVGRRVPMTLAQARCSGGPTGRQRTVHHPSAGGSSHPNGSAWSGPN